MLRSAAILAALALATSAHAAGQQFDLVCQGTVTGPAKSDPKPWSERYAIDLDAGAWCRSPCIYPLPLSRADPGTLWLRDKGDLDRRDEMEVLFVNRVTGLLEGQDGSPRYYEANCAAADFTAFPKTQF